MWRDSAPDGGVERAVSADEAVVAVFGRRINWRAIVVCLFQRGPAHRSINGDLQDCWDDREYRCSRSCGPERIFLEVRPIVDWEWMLVVGLALGAFVSSRLSGDKATEPVESLWRLRFGASRWKRYLVAFFGGVILMFGARLAGGCTSGHGISGSLQLALSGWVFFASVFASGILTALVLFGKENAHD